MTTPKQQLVLIADDPVFPSTRFQGSKLKIVDWIWEAIKDLKFYTALDAFGGTGCVSYMLKENQWIDMVVTNIRLLLIRK